MEKSHLYSFSTRSDYRFIIFSNSPVNNLALESFHITNTENTSEGIVIRGEKTVKDQAHLLSFINTLNQYHLTLLLVEKLK